MVQHQPSAAPADYLGAHYHPDAGAMPQPPPLASNYPSYELQDDGPVDGGADDIGDMPLLNRGPSTLSQPPGMPGAYDGEGPMDEDSNIRYGRIPQRVPRRYKTMKKVE